MAGLLAWASLIAFPSRLLRDSGRSIQQREWKTGSGKRDKPIYLPYSPFTTLTATGIAPDLHRISLFILRLRRRNQIAANVGIEVFQSGRVFNKVTFPLKQLVIFDWPARIMEKLN
jgi:hypothetical protein